jgi:ankyrin repeat protein
MNLKELEEVIQLAQESGLTEITLRGVTITREMQALILSTEGIEFLITDCLYTTKKTTSSELAVGSSKTKATTTFLEYELPTDVSEKRLFLDQLYQKFGFHSTQEAIPSLKLRNQFPKDMNEEEKSAKVQALLFLIKHDERLRAIDLSDNHLGDDAISLIADSLKDNKNISKVNFENTRCYKDDALDKIMMMLRINKKIRRFTISFSDDAPSPDLKKIELLRSELERKKSSTTLYNTRSTMDVGGIKLFKMIAENDVASLRRYPGNIHLTNSDGLNALMLAARLGNFNALHYCILWGVGRSIDKQNIITGKTALMEACANEDRKCAELLIKNGASLTIEDKAGKTASYYAKYYDLAEIKDSFRSEYSGYGLEDRSQGLKIKLNSNGKIIERPIGSYLASATRRCDLGALMKFRQYWELVVDEDGRNILMSAFKSVESIIASIRKTEKEAIKDEMEMSALDSPENIRRREEAAIKNALEMIEIIIKEAPRLLNSFDDYGCSCLLFAVVEKGSREFLQLLSEKDALMHINIPDCFGLTPLHIAIRDRKTDEIKLLIENGANLGAINFEGFSPLDFADHEIKSFVESLVSELNIADTVIKEFSLQHLLLDQSTTSATKGRLSLSTRLREEIASTRGRSASAAGAGAGAGAAAGGGSASAADERLVETGGCDFSEIGSKSALIILNNILSRSRDPERVIKTIEDDECNPTGRILLNKVRSALEEESIKPAFKTDLLKQYFQVLEPYFSITEITRKPRETREPSAERLLSQQAMSRD